MTMKVVDGALLNIDVDPELRDLAKDLRYVATLIEKGEVNSIALCWTGTHKDGDVEYKDGVGITWTVVGGNAYTLSGGLAQIQHELHSDITRGMQIEEDA